MLKQNNEKKQDFQHSCTASNTDKLKDGMEDFINS